MFGWGLDSRRHKATKKLFELGQAVRQCVGQIWTCVAVRGFGSFREGMHMKYEGPVKSVI